MMSIRPVNNHIIIEPLKHDSFVPTTKGTFEEVGIVISVPKTIEGIPIDESVKVGDKVYFDSWLASRYPKNDKESFWLVRWEDVRAIESNES